MKSLLLLVAAMAALASCRLIGDRIAESTGNDVASRLPDGPVPKAISQLTPDKITQDLAEALAEYAGMVGDVFGAVNPAKDWQKVLDVATKTQSALTSYDKAYGTNLASIFGK